MRILDALLGRTRPVGSRLDDLFGMSTAEITMATELDQKPAGAAAISFKPVSSGDFAGLEKEIGDLLRSSQWDDPLQYDTATDSFGYHWIVLRSGNLEALVTAVHAVSRELYDSGYGDRTLAAVFRFRAGDGRQTYWIYNYKKGTWYPFVPGGRRNRDNALELRMSGIMKGELAVEPDMTTWFPLWDLPI